MAGTPTPPNPSPWRIVVIGTSGAGKTTLAGRLSTRLSIPHVQLDALHWEPNWTEAAPEVLRARVAAALQGDAWVVDGNYTMLRDLTWCRAHLVVWLDYGLPRIMAQLVRRTLRRALTREEIWNGNRESLRTALFSRDSILLWALQTYRQRRREYRALFGQPEHRHLTVIHLRSPRETAHWLAGLPGAPRGLPPDVAGQGGVHE